MAICKSMYYWKSAQNCSYEYMEVTRLCQCTHQELRSQHKSCYPAVAPTRTGFCYFFPSWPWMTIVCFCQTDAWVITKELLIMNSILIPHTEWHRTLQQVKNIFSSQWPIARHFLLPAQHHEVYCSAHKRRGPEITEKGSETDVII